MDRRRRIIFTTMLVVLLLGSLVLASCGKGQEETATPTLEQEEVTPLTLNGQVLVQERCTKCHDLARVTGAKKTLAQWKTTVTRMVTIGADLNLEEQEAVNQYLAEAYPK